MKFLLMVALLSIHVFAIGQLDRKSVFHALSSSSKELINKELNHLKALKESEDQKAFKGAILMKLSQFQKTQKEKLEMFKMGKELLENEIAAAESNVEYKVLRLMIQENAPNMLKYNSKILEDSAKIVSGFSKLKEHTKDAVKEYAKVSKYLSELK